MHCERVSKPAYLAALEKLTQFVRSRPGSLELPVDPDLRGCLDCLEFLAVPSGRRYIRSALLYKGEAVAEADIEAEAGMRAEAGVGAERGT